MFLFQAISKLNSENTFFFFVAFHRPATVFKPELFDRRTLLLFASYLERIFVFSSQVLWKAYIDFEINLEEYDRTRDLYERLLKRTQHVKVCNNVCVTKKIIFAVVYSNPAYNSLNAFLSGTSRLLIVFLKNKTANKQHLKTRSSRARCVTISRCNLIDAAVFESVLNPKIIPCVFSFAGLVKFCAIWDVYRSRRKHWASEVSKNNCYSFRCRTFKALLSCEIKMQSSWLSSPKKRNFRLSKAT